MLMRRNSVYLRGHIRFVRAIHLYRAYRLVKALCSNNKTDYERLIDTTNNKTERLIDKTSTLTDQLHLVDRFNPPSELLPLTSRTPVITQSTH